MNNMCSLRRLLDGCINAQQSEEIAGLMVSGLTLDSRNVSQGWLFVALQGTQSHGLDFAIKAEKQGAVAIIWEPFGDAQVPSKLTIPTISIANLGQCLGSIAGRYYGNPSHDLNMIGITGTDGKTSVSHFLAQAINNAKGDDSCSVIGTLGVGRPDNLRMATHTTPDVITVHGILQQEKQEGVNTVAMEVSSHALDQGRVNAVRFDTAVLTNLTRDHLDYHGTLEAYEAAKEKLFHWPKLKSVVVNLDDAMGLRLAKELANSDVRVIGYGVGEPKKLSNNIETIFAAKVSFDHRGIVASIVTPIGEGMLIAPILGKFNLSNLLAVLAVLIIKNTKLDDALKQIQSVATVPGRMERVVAKGDSSSVLVVVDYAHTPGAMEQALLAVREHSQRNLICVFGCGGDRDTGKRPLMAEVAERLANRVIVTDDNPRSESAVNIFSDIEKGFEDVGAITFEHDRQKAIKLAINEAQAGDVVLIAGKGHETVQFVKSQKIPFDDRVEAANYLEGKAA